MLLVHSRVGCLHDGVGTAAKQSIMRVGKKSVPAGFEPARVSPKDHPKLDEFGDTLKCRSRPFDNSNPSP